MPIDNRWYDGLGAAWWDTRGPVAALHELNPVRVAYFVEVLRRERPAARRVLDGGCGGGLVAEALAREGFNVVGLDASLPSLRAAREHASRNGVSVAYLGGDVQRLPFGDEAFDAVVLAELIEHVDDPDRLLRDVARVLAPGGLLLFDTPNRTWRSRLGLIWVAETLGWAPRHAPTSAACSRPRSSTPAAPPPASPCASDAGSRSAAPRRLRSGATCDAASWAASTSRTTCSSPTSATPPSRATASGC